VARSWLTLWVGVVCAVAHAQNTPAPFGTVGVNPNTRFSSLARIDRNNVAALKPAFTFRTGRLGAQGSAPLIVPGDGSRASQLLLLSSFPHTLFSIDLSKPGDKPQWEVTPTANLSAEGLNCCERVHLGPVSADGKVYFSTLDGHVIAVDPTNGKPLWDVTVADPSLGETLASAPIVIGDRLLIGNAGDDFGARGWIAALESSTGHTVWKRYSTGPDQDVGISPRFQLLRTNAPQLNLGEQTWPTDSWQRGGGSVSGLIAYDPVLQLLFHTTGPAAPWNPEPRPGDNRWTAGIFARDPATGEAHWFTSLHAHSPFAWRAGGANVLVDWNWGGQSRSLLVHADADGQIYVLDQRSGEVLARDFFIKTRGAPEISSSQPPRTNAMVRDVCPAWVGAVGGDPALSQATGWLYVAANHLCMDIEGRNANYIQGTAFVGANVRVSYETVGPGGEILAWDLGARKATWRVQERFPIASDVLATAGGVVFYGTLDGTLKAIDAQTGALLWHFETSAPLMGQPTTYLGPDGRQYVAVVVGASGPFGLAQQAWIDRRDATAVRGLARIMADVPRPRDPSGALYVFALP
jgi:PQQ-dependent dehydrogenase (methanol/ethanol family)